MLDEELFKQLKAVSDRLAKIEKVEREKPSWDKAWSGLAVVNYADLPPAAAPGEMRFINDLGAVMVYNGASWERIAPTAKRASMWAEEVLPIIGAAATSFTDAGQLFNIYTLVAANNGDAFSHSFSAQSGDYTLYVLGMTNNNCGRLQWSLDGTAFGAVQDWYSAALVRNVYKSATVDVPTDGHHVLRGDVVGKNGASGGFLIDLTKFWLAQAAD